MRIPSLSRGNHSESGKTRTCITAKGHEKAKGGGGGTRRYNDASFFFFRCTTTAELRLEVRLSVAASFSTCSLNTCSGEPWLAGRPCLSRTDLPCSDAVYAERNTSRSDFQTKNEPQRRNTLTWKMFLILRSYQTTGQNR